MEERKVNFSAVIACAVLLGTLTAFVAQSTLAGSETKEPRVIYPKKTELDFEGLQIEGEVRNPGEFYFQHRPGEKFDSLVKRRKNFHREMLRDVVLSK
jgi:hypothetical protein